MVYVIVLECKSVLHVIHVRLVLVIKHVAGAVDMLTHGCGNTCDPVSSSACPTLVCTVFFQSVRRNGCKGFRAPCGRPE